MKGKIFISFDVDGTLIKPDYDNLIWFKEIPELYAKKYGISISKAREIVKKEYDRIGDKDPRWYVPQFWLERFKLEVREEEILQKYQDEIEIYEDAKLCLSQLYKKYPLVVLSAMPHCFLKIKLKKDNLYRYFRKAFSAVSDFNMVKKEEGFYRRVCKILEISPSSLVHVGDNYQADYLTPRKLGVKAFYLKRTNSKSFSSSFTVSDLLEFVYRLDQLI